MICKNSNYKNVYMITNNSTDEDFQKIIKGYSNINCIICNDNTAKKFKSSFIDNPSITINKKLNDNEFLLMVLIKLFYGGKKNGKIYKEKKRLLVE